MSGEWPIVASEYAMYLENRHLWLGEKDADWHVPLNIIIEPADVGTNVNVQNKNAGKDGTST